MFIVNQQGQWFVGDDQNVTHCGPFPSYREAADWIESVKSTAAPRGVSADKIALLLSEDARPSLDNIPYLAVKIVEGIESGDLLQTI